MGQLARVEQSPEQILAQHLDSWEAHVSAWVSVSDEITKRQFLRGLIAASVETRYGESSIKQFASEVNEPVSTVYHYRDVYRKCHEFSTRVENLSWSHYALIVKAGCEDEERETLLEAAAEQGWSARQLKREAGVRKVAARLAVEAPHIDPQMAAGISHWDDLRGSVERFAKSNPQFAMYAEDFIAAVEEAIEHPWESAREFIERLIYGGCREVEFLAKASQWKRETVERICGELVDAGTHEWRDKGGKTDEARGARPQLIVPIDEMRGDAYESYRGASMTLIVEDDED